MNKNKNRQHYSLPSNILFLAKKLTKDNIMKDSINNIISFWKITIKSSKKFVVLLIVNIIFSAMIPFPAIILSKKIFDLLATGKSIRDFLIVSIILVLLTFALNFISTILNSKVEIKGQQLMYSLSVSYNIKSTNISYELLSNPKTLEKRELAGKAVNGSNFIDMIRCVSNIMSNLLVLIGVIALFIKVDIIIILVVSIVIIINTYANNLIKKAQYNYSVEVTPYMRKVSYIQSVSSGLEHGKEIRINGFKPLLLKKIQELNDVCFEFIKKIVNSQVRGIKISHITNGIQDIVVYGLLGVKVIIDKTMSIGDFSMYFGAIAQFKSSLVTIITTLTDIKINSLYMGHFLEYMKLPEESECIGSSSAINNEFEINNIYFDNVSFSYPGTDIFALKNVTFEINEFEKLSIVGVNGSGKTTIIKLLLRLYKPTEGNIFINNININEINYNDYIKYFSVVFQDFKLLAFTIKENLCNDQEPDELELDNIMSKVNLMDRINSLPNKYNTNYSRMFDECGVEFSGGESQKLAIARALYKDARIVIMDEPTAALDPLAEYEIYKDFDELTKGKTSIYISHRLSSCKFCDKIILLDNGSIKEFGSHNYLMEQNGLYADMYLKQAQYYTEQNIKENKIEI